MALEKECQQRTDNRFCLVDVEKAEKNWLLGLATSKSFSSLKLKKDFLSLKRRGVYVRHEWIRAQMLPSNQRRLRVAWSLSRKNLPRAFDRNRLKRFGKELLKESGLQGDLRIYFLNKEKGFYSCLRRENFDDVFKNFIKKTKTIR